ncbi:Transposase DDE domain protein [Anaerohalosphaera lusitana]|uniref:Transposase DDE domain protein n=1 Tax=Anaerohalosphaera lusitana TaxID=1936003 RepID=A0A1U9NS14_9BACT|nr:IS5 family transposase [Anaerohalosphaera lusitana]AQT70306.1 Transposase DDE domain protein [Anaerohalosphaera lusitana]
MERSRNQPTFLDNVISELGGRRTAKFFAKCDKYIPWDELAKPLKDMYSNNTSKGGASNWPVIMMVKCIMLQKWFNLSDPMLEEMLLDRLSFRRFVGLSMDDNTPDETTFVRFRKRLREHRHDRTLFEKTLEILSTRGVILAEGTCVDATIVEAPRGRKRADGSNTRDAEAGFTKKNGRSYHGYKAHIATDTNGMVKDYRFSSARHHDSKFIDELIENETQSVWADSAYMSAEREERLGEKGVLAGIVHRRKRGQAELNELRQIINRIISRVRAVVEHPFAWMKNAGYGKVRYRGLERNRLDFAMHAVAYNFKRSFSLHKARA